ncbi:MAG TPA: dienelactone hydrolase family protein [Caulobacteraceae bacterium]|jgi:dienelactone hydrolase|nr:dienelactone hydrolase family protein [Caulobacteraceae bacterium]
MEKRWARLGPKMEVYGPKDSVPRPAVVLFHGCGGLRDHIRHYAEAAASQGYRAFVIDSFAPRGWTRAFGLMFVCTGLQFQGAERAGDVLASCWGIDRRPDVDSSKIVLAGWSHGSWSIMDLMTMPLTAYGEAYLEDPSPAPLAGVQGLFLSYPYGGFGALSRTRPWVRSPRTLGIIALQDHVTAAGDADRIYQPAIKSGAEVEIWRVQGTHAFDEEHASAGIMRYDKALTEQAHEKFKGFLLKTLGPAETAQAKSA